MFRRLSVDQRGFFERNLDRAAAAFVACVSASVIDQDVSHHLGAYGEEVRAILPFESFLTREFQISLVDQSGCLQRVARAFVTHLAARDAAQFRVDERKQFVERRLVAFTPSGEQLGYFLRRDGGHRRAPSATGTFRKRRGF